MTALIVTVLLTVVVTLSPIAALAQALLEGFGAGTPGGAGKPVYRVTNLSDSGAGSLRDAVSQSNRYIVFDVEGTITIRNDLRITGSFITIDGSTAPGQGITLTGGGALSIESGAHDIIVREIRVHDAADDGFRVDGAHDVVFDHVSAYNSGDGNLDITEGSYNVTVQWSVLIKPSGTGNMLIKYNTYGVTLHHNLFNGIERNPLLSVDETATTSSRLMADIRNNIVWNWGAAGGSQFGFGTGVDHGAWANIENNFYQTSGSYRNLAQLAIDLNHNGSGARVFLAGNVSGNGVDLNHGNVSERFAAPAITSEQACAAATRVLQGAGVRPLDSIDQSYVSKVSLANCPGAGGPVPLPAPRALQVR